MCVPPPTRLRLTELIHFIFLHSTKQTLTSLESRLVPYFFMNHPTHGALVGPFRKLSNPSFSSTPESRTRRVGFLALDVAVTLLGLDQTSNSGSMSKEAETLEKAVTMALLCENTALEGNMMATEMRKYWEDVVLMMKKQNWKVRSVDLKCIDVTCTGRNVEVYPKINDFLNQWNETEWSLFYVYKWFVCGPSRWERYTYG